MTARRRMLISPVLRALALCLVVSSPVRAHGDLHQKIEALTKQIDQEPTNGELYLTRGELHRAHRDWNLALADYDRADRLNPKLAVTDLLRGLTLLASGPPEAAITALDRFLIRQPDHGEARVARARASIKLGRHLAAAEDFTRALAKMTAPKPEYYLERAQALALLGDARIDDALRGLDEGIKTLGPIVTLELLAVELDLRKSKYESALARLEQIAAQSARKEMWLARRGEILERAGRPGDARREFAAALAALETIPPQRRSTKATREMEARVRTALERLGAASNNSTGLERP
ncbi:MAG: tetratricopeptide repeat protein, partial [Gammaproteobacteria bacterium]